MFDDAFCCHKIQKKINNFNKEFLACVNFGLLNTKKIAPGRVRINNSLIIFF